MAEAHNLTIGEVIADLKENNYLLPAIQREFVWKTDRICNLFDSLMRGYPIGTFLFWKIPPEKVEDYRFYAFMKSYHQRDNNRCQLLDRMPSHGFQAVLDGQQRMTALFIGLCGTYAVKRPYGRWEDDSAFPKTRLYLNLLHDPEETTEEDEQSGGRRYAFEFKTDEEAEKGKQKGEWWFRCDRICEKGWKFADFCSEIFEVCLKEVVFPDASPEQLDDLRTAAAKTALRIVERFNTAINVKPELTYFQEKTDKLDRVLNIFIRLNAGGVALSYSDLLLSIAIAQWKDKDAREEINNLKSSLWRSYDFDLSKDFILKASLMLSDISSIKFSVENFNKENTRKLETNWDMCKKYLRLAVSLLRSFGYTSQNLSATNAILPVAYYLKMINADEGYQHSSKYLIDRNRLLLWFNRSILKQGTWGAGVDTFLSQLRETIRTSVLSKEGFERFPYEEIEKTMSRSGRSLKFSPEEVDELLELNYGNARTFTLLTVLFPTSAIQMRDEHVDHVFPHSLFGRKKFLADAGYTDEEISVAQWKRNLLPNLQLLPSTINREKSDSMPLDWIEATFPEEFREQFCHEQLLANLSNDPKSFFKFYDERRNKLRRLIKQKLDIPLDEDDKDM